MAEIKEHLAAAKEAEAEKIKAEEEAAAAAAAEAEEEAAKEVPEEEQVSEAAKTMFRVGAIALTEEGINKLLSGVDDGNVNKLPEHDDHSEVRGERTITPPNYPYV